MFHFGLNMQTAYQFVKDKRPAISPNLNFMGQLVAFEKEMEMNKTRAIYNIDDYLPTEKQEKLTELFQIDTQKSSSSSNESTPSPKPNSSPGSGFGALTKSPFVLKLPIGKNKKGKKSVSVTAGQWGFLIQKEKRI